MKKLLLLLIPFASLAQNKSALGLGLTAGYSSKQSAAAEMYFSIPINKLIVYPFSMKVHSKLSDPTMPVIIEPRIGYKINSFEVYGGYGYHFAGQDSRAEFDKYKGFRPGAGIIFHFKKIIITTAMSGNIWTIQAGLFGTH